MDLRFLYRAIVVTFFSLLLDGCVAISSVMINDLDRQYHAGRYEQVVRRIDSEYPRALRRQWFVNASNDLAAGKHADWNLIKYHFNSRRLVVALIETNNFPRARAELSELLREQDALSALYARHPDPLPSAIELQRETLYTLRLLQGYLDWISSGDTTAFRNISTEDIARMEPRSRVPYTMERALFQEKILGHYPAALTQLRDVLRLTNSLGLGDADTRFAYSMQAYRRMAWIQMRMGRLSEAKATLDEYSVMEGDLLLSVGRMVFGSTEYFRGYLSMMYSTAGAVHGASRDFVSAARSFESAKESLSAMPPNSDHMWDRNALAAYHVLYGVYFLGLQGQHREAGASIEEGLKYLRPAYFDAVLTEIDIESAYLYAAELHFVTGNLPLATKRATQAIEYANRYRNVPVAASAHTFLGTLYFQSGRLMEALGELQRARELSGSAESAENWRLYHWLGKVTGALGQQDSLDWHLRAVEEVEKFWNGRFDDAVRQVTFIEDKLAVYEPTIIALLRLKRPADALGVVEKAKARSLYGSQVAEAPTRSGGNSDGTPLASLRADQGPAAC